MIIDVQTILMALLGIMFGIISGVFAWLFNNLQSRVKNNEEKIQDMAVELSTNKTKDDADRRAIDKEFESLNILLDKISHGQEKILDEFSKVNDRYNNLLIANPELKR